MKKYYDFVRRLERRRSRWERKNRGVDTETRLISDALLNQLFSKNCNVKLPNSAKILSTKLTLFLKYYFLKYYLTLE